MTDYVHLATGETGIRGRQAKQAEDYFTSLPRRRFSLESLNAITRERRLLDFYCKPCTYGDHGACRGYPEHNGRRWGEDANGERAFVYDDRASRTPWEKNTTASDGRWSMYGQIFTETLRCQCAVHDHPALHPMFEGKCMVTLRSEWGAGVLCGKPAKGTVTRDSIGGVSRTGFEVAACGLHIGVAKRKKAYDEKFEAEQKARDAAFRRERANRQAAEEWAAKLTELTGIQFTASQYGDIVVSAPPEPLYAVLDKAEAELRQLIGIGLKEMGDL